MLLLSSPTFYRVFGECSKDELFYAHTVDLGFSETCQEGCKHKNWAILAKHAFFFGCFKLSVVSCLLRALLETVPQCPGWESGLPGYQLVPFFPLKNDPQLITIGG